MIFASTPPINDDPNPYVWAKHSPYDKSRTDTEQFRAGGSAGLVKYFDYEFAPRPEYDRPRAHEANPILLAYRKFLLTEGLDDASDQWLFATEAFWTFGGFKEWDQPESSFHAFTTSSKDQIQHAYRVLTRLAEFEVSV